MAQGSDFTAGYDRVAYERGESLGGGRWSEPKAPRGALVHAVMDNRPRHAPRDVVFLDWNGADKRVSVCGQPIKVLLPRQFNEGATDACPECLERVPSVVFPPKPQRRYTV